MSSLSPFSLLDVWGRGTTQSPVQQALLLLSVAYPEESPTALAQCSIGQRNTRLLNLREQLFGSQFVSVAACPQCGECLELNFKTADIRVSSSDESVTSLTLDVADYSVQCRLPNSIDLASVAGCQEAAVVEQMLLERCLLSVQSAGEEISLEMLPAEIVAAIAEAMERADSQANIQLSLTCPACTHQWQAILDILSYVWSELDAWARRILCEVHALASAYGWSEADILNMQPWRRQIYMDMIDR